LIRTKSELRPRTTEKVPLLFLRSFLQQAGPLSENPSLPDQSSDRVFFNRNRRRVQPQVHLYGAGRAEVGENQDCRSVWVFKRNVREVCCMTLRLKTPRSTAKGA